MTTTQYPQTLDEIVVATSSTATLCKKGLRVKLQQGLDKAVLFYQDLA